MAVVVVALPLAWLRLAVDDYERSVIDKMSHKELIAFVKEVHASSFASADLLAVVAALVFVAAVEAVAFVVCLGIGLWRAGKPPHVREQDWDGARAGACP